jgi:hypothetical protein
MAGKAKQKETSRGAVKDPKIDKDSGIVKAKYRQNYAKNDDSNGDDLAEVLRGAVTSMDDKNRVKLDLEKLHKVANDNGIDWKKFSHLNNGQQRMTIGNMLRKIAKKDGKIKINGKFVTISLDAA